MTMFSGRSHALLEAARKGNAWLVREYLERGICDHNENDWYGESLLYRAAVGGHGDAIRILLDHGADANSPLSNHAPLHAAAQLGSVASAILLLQPGGSDTPPSSHL